MRPVARLRSNGKLFATALPLLLSLGCLRPDERAVLQQENRTLRDEVERLERGALKQDGQISELKQRIVHLSSADAQQNAEIFAPTEVRFATMTGGADYDGNPGDDGITVYIQPVDRYGDAIKAPGRLTVQLLDNSDLAAPRLLGAYRFEDADTLASAWFGRFGTSHYTLKCRFPENTVLPASGKLNVTVEFVDYRTGRTLTATQEIEFSTSAQE